MTKSGIAMGLMSLAAMVALGATPVSAQGDSQTMLKDYQSAIYAKELCGGKMFDQAEYNKLGAPIASKTGIEMTAGQRLMLVDEVKPSVDHMVGLDRKGCESEEVTKLLQLYDTDLAPALQ